MFGFICLASLFAAVLADYPDRCTYGGQNPGSVLTDIHGINSYDCYEFTSSQNKFLLAQNTKDELCRYQLEATLKQSNNYTILANIIFDFGARRNREDSYKCNVKVGENKNVSKLRMPDENCIFEIETYPFTTTCGDVSISLSVSEGQIHLSSDTCDWAWSYTYEGDDKETIDFHIDNSVQGEAKGACNEPAHVCSYGKDRVDDASSDLKDFCGNFDTPYVNENSYILGLIMAEDNPCRFCVEVLMDEVEGFVEMSNVMFKFGSKTSQEEFSEEFTVGSCGPISKYGTEVLDVGDYPRNVNGTYIDLEGDVFIITNPECPWRLEYSFAEDQVPKEWVQLVMKDPLNQLDGGVCVC